MYGSWLKGVQMKNVPIDSGDLKQFMPLVKQTQSAGKEFNSVPIQGKKLLTLTFLWHQGVMIEKYHII